MPPVPAVCKLQAFGGVSVSYQSSGKAILPDSVSAEQHIAPGSISGTLTGGGGDRLSAVAVVHPEKNLMLLTVTWHGAPTNITVATWTNGQTGAVTPMGVVSRRLAPNASYAAAAPYRVMWNALSSRLVLPNGTAQPEQQLSNGSFGNYGASYSIQVASGTSFSVITALADNLLAGNQDDPSTAAHAMATGASVAEIETASTEACFG